MMPVAVRILEASRILGREFPPTLRGGEGVKLNEMESSFSMSTTASLPMLSGHADDFTLNASFDGAAAHLAYEEALRLIPDLGMSAPDDDGDDDARDIEVERDHISITENFLETGAAAQRVCEDYARKAKADTFALVYRLQGKASWHVVVVRMRVL